jgi:hypothetical protein
MYLKLLLITAILNILVWWILPIAILCWTYIHHAIVSNTKAYKKENYLLWSLIYLSYYKLINRDLGEQPYEEQILMTAFVTFGIPTIGILFWPLGIPITLYALYSIIQKYKRTKWSKRLKCLSWKQN